jgi:hypothetical protein
VKALFLRQTNDYKQDRGDGLSRRADLPTRRD